MPSTQSASAEAGGPASAAAAWYLGRTTLRNRCNLSPWALASQAFQDDPRQVEIAWVRVEHQGFLSLMARLDDAAERAACFDSYCLDRFWMHEERANWPDEAKRRRQGYAGVLRGWGVDSSGASGAVLKGWAEDRFGLRPVWHRTALSQSDAQERFEAERQRGATGGIGMQLDLLYTWSQDELRRRFPRQRWLTLYRGTHDPESYVVKEESRCESMVEFNNLSSFTGDAEVAWEFGSRVWEVQVPLAKLVCGSALLPGGPLQGEQEWIVLGGDYRVRTLVC
jgi:NAD+--dinitrogen-reductase ADP-D-ribosyltransferase